MEELGALTECSGLNGGLQKGMAMQSSLEPVNMTLKGKRESKSVSWGIWVGLRCSHTCPYKTHKEEGGGVATKAAIGEMRPQAQDHLGPPEAGRGTGQILPESLQREYVRTHTAVSDIWPPELGNWRHFCCLKPLSLGYFVTAAAGN